MPSLRCTFKIFAGKIDVGFSTAEIVIYHFLLYREILLTFSVAYQSKMLMVPFDWVARVLKFPTDDQMVQDCKYYGIHVDQQSKAVRFFKTDFNAEKPLVTKFHLTSDKTRIAKITVFFILNACRLSRGKSK